MTDSVDVGDRRPVVRQAALWVCVVVAVAVVASAAAVWKWRGSGRPSAPRPLSVAALLERSDPLLGVLGFSGNYVPQERAADVGAVTISVSWVQAEPLPGSFDLNYLATINSQIDAATAAGFSVVIDPGPQYPPAWVFDLDGGTHFVDQYGDVFSSATASGENVANAVTDPAVRLALSGYLAGLGGRLDMANVVAVRQGGGPFGELRYPDTDYAGHTNCYWAYDSSSQADVALAYRPGRGTPAEAQAFLTRYNTNLVDFAVWMNGQYLTDFHRVTLVLLPGWGERPKIAALETAHLLTLNYPEFNQGLDWSDLLPALPDRAHSIAYTTYLDAPSLGATPQSEDPADFLASLASPLHFDLGGENTGSDNTAALKLTLSRADRLHLKIVSWFNEQQLASASRGQTAPTFADLGTTARSEL